MSHRLNVQVNDELTLDAGTIEERAAADGAVMRTIEPPGTTMFQQLIAYLDAKPHVDPTRGTVSGREGVAATALCLRWGSYFAVLADTNKPIWPEAAAPQRRDAISRISDAEMARINIEASAALGAWVDMFVRDGGLGDYMALVHKAVAYLPMPQQSVTGAPMPRFLRLCSGSAMKAFNAAIPADKRAEGYDSHFADYPSRSFANALIHSAWRNGPVEDFHAGVSAGLPLEHRRLSTKESGALVKHTASHITTGMRGLLNMRWGKPHDLWAQQAAPFALDTFFGVTPEGWSLTDVSRCIENTIRTGTSA